MYELLIITVTKAKTEVLRHCHICYNLSHTEYKVTPNVRPKTKKAMTIFPMRGSNKHVSGSFALFKPHSWESQVLRVSSLWQAYWFLPNTHKNYFFIRVLHNLDYSCICLLVECLTRLKPYEEKYNAFFHLLLTTVYQHCYH